MNSTNQVIIIGNGISGVTTARYLRMNNPDVPILLISAESKYFYSRTALMYLYMGHMQFNDLKPYEDFFWKKNNIELVHGFVTTIDTNQKRITLSHGQSFQYDKLVLAVGAKPKYFGWDGQDLKGIQGLYSLQDLEELEENTRSIHHATIVGGGLIGIELAEMLHSRHTATSFLVRESSFMNQLLPTEESEMVNEEIRNQGIDLRLSTEVKRFTGDEVGRVSRVQTSNKEEIATQMVGICIGVEPNISFLKDSTIETERGILIDEQFETSIKDVFAVGDCAQFRTPLPDQRPIEQLWYTGKMQGKVLGQRLAGESISYQKGIFFNSAKFFDIEFQTYGKVNPQLKPHEVTLFWKHPTENKSIRINYDTSSKAVLGFNLMGVRFRQEVCAQWIADKATIQHVLENLELANFDPEFYRSHASNLRKIYEQQTGEKIARKKTRWYKHAFSQ